MYVPMNLTLKSKSWAGNIYHQLESICQDVDDFVNKDTVRFVEDQVQSVGISVKKFYCNVVKDILPSSGDGAKCESPSVNSELSETQDPVEADRGIKQGPTVEHKLFENEGPFDTTTSISVPEATDSFADNAMFSIITDEDYQNSTPTTHEEGLLLTKEMGKVDFSYSEEHDMEYLLNTSSSDWLFESELPTMKDMLFDNNRSSCDLVLDDGFICDLSSKDEGFDLLRSSQLHECACTDISCDEEPKEDTGSKTPSCSISPECSESSDILDPTCESVLKKDETIGTSHPECNGSAYGVASLSSSDADCGTKAVNELRAFLTFESSGFFTGLYKVEMSWPSETENTCGFVAGIGDNNMEAVDLSPSMMHDEASVILSRNLSHLRTNGRRNFRYYKKLLHDAITSRKTLSKEYKHLSILYGDIHSESSQNIEAVTTTSSPNASAHAMSKRALHETSDTEWELV